MDESILVQQRGLLARFKTNMQGGIQSENKFKTAAGIFCQFKHNVSQIQNAGLRYSNYRNYLVMLQRVGTAMRKGDRSDQNLWKKWVFDEVVMPLSEAKSI